MFSNTIPLYLINGFLEGGKTSFIQDVLTNGDFADGQKTLLILCEEGEVGVRSVRTDEFEYSLSDR